MNGRFLLDTNIVIALFAGERKVAQRLRKAETVFLPAIVLGELFYGAFKSKQIAANVSRIEEFAAANTVMVCDLETARHYGQIKQELRGKGRPLPENDIWVAGLARQHDLTLVTRDQHFDEMGDFSSQTVVDRQRNRE